MYDGHVKLHQFMYHFIVKTRKHSSRMRTNRAVTRLNSEQVVIRPIVDRQITCEDITFPLRSVIMSDSLTCFMHFKSHDHPMCCLKEDKIGNARVHENPIPKLVYQRSFGRKRKELKTWKYFLPGSVIALLSEARHLVV